MNVVLRFLILLVIPIHAFSQTEQQERSTLKWKYDVFVFNCGLHQGWRSSGDISVGLADTRLKYFHMPTSWHFREVHIGSQFNFDWQKALWGPHISYDAVWDFKGAPTLFGYGGDLIYYTNGSNSGLYLNPHLGIRWYAFLNLLVGYNIPISDSGMKPYVNTYTVTLSFTFFKRETSKSLE